MRCNVCGRELKDGQMFCQCGNTINNMGAGALDVNRERKSNRILLIGGLAGFAVVAIMAIIFISAFLGYGKQLTDRSKWENRSKSAYSITLPSNMKETDLDPGYANMTHLDTYRSNDAIVTISYMPYTAEQKRYLKRNKVVEQIKEWAAEKAKGDDSVTALEHGEMIYFEYQEDLSGAFLGSSKVECIESFYVSNDALYSVGIIMPVSTYSKHQDVVFAWMDSFRPKTS